MEIRRGFLECRECAAGNELRNREKSVFWHGKGVGGQAFLRDSHLKTVYIVPKIRYNSLYCVITQGYIKYEMKEY